MLNVKDINSKEIIPLEYVLRLFLTERCYIPITFYLLVHPQLFAFQNVVDRSTQTGLLVKLGKREPL